MSGLSTLPYGPNHERLTATHVAGRKYLADGSDIAACIGLYVAARIERHIQVLDQALMRRMHEAHRQQDEVGRKLKLGSGDRLEIGAAPRAAQLLYRACFADEFNCQHGEVTLNP